MENHHEIRKGYYQQGFIHGPLRNIYPIKNSDLAPSDYQSEIWFWTERVNIDQYWRFFAEPVFLFSRIK